MDNIWDQRYSSDDYFFGTAPNAFLQSQQAKLRAGMRCLALADGEGRNGVWLAQQGLDVLSVDNSTLGIAKAQRLASEKAVTLQIELADVLQSDWQAASYDVVVAIFIQFASPSQRIELFDKIKKCLKVGGLLLLQGYTPRQLDYKTGGPSQAENLYTESLLRAELADMAILHLLEHDDEIHEGSGHSGMSALIDLVAQKS